MSTSIPNPTKTVSFKHGEKTITLSTGTIAQQATAAVWAQVDDTKVLVSLTASKKINPDADFLPLSVHFQKRSYSEGRITGKFTRREGQPSDAEVLVSRLIDRPCRALFPRGFYHEVQLVPMLLSSDPNVKSDIPALIASSAAVALSGLPGKAPFYGVRVASVDNQFVLNPTPQQLENSDLDLVMTSTHQGIIMVEAEANEIEASTLVEAIMFGHEHKDEILKAIETLSQKAGQAKWKWESTSEDIALEQKVTEIISVSLTKIHQMKDTLEQKSARSQLKEEMIAQLVNEEAQITTQKLNTLFKKIETQLMRQRILSGKSRLDQRSTKTIRPITIESQVLPRAHGSVLFTRGATQALVTATLGTERDAQLVEDLEGEYRDTFLLHYNFPPYCVGEVGAMGSPKRREIGHGNLAKRALRAVLPSEAECPYVLRIVSEIMSSDGSSSMATVCGASLALMDAGIALKRPVAGIAMGLVKEDTQFAILSDISADEDHIGDMDLKVAGTKKGITALQMDIKTDEGISKEIILAALNQAQEGIHSILDTMEQAMPTPRTSISAYAPQIVNMKIPVDKIQVLIGKGGATIRNITTETKTLIDIDRETGLIRVSSPDQAACHQAIEKIKEITAEPAELEIGTIYSGSVVKLIDSGGFIAISSGRKGFLHISEALTTSPEQTIRDVLKEKQTIKVKVLEIDRQRNRIRLTMKGIESDEAS